MTLHYEDAGLRLFHGSNKVILPTLPDASYDSIVTDPPYELGFMGKGWDSTGIAYDVDMWAECLRVLKPGGHLLAFGGTRTWHRIAAAIEDAGFEIRDSIAWMYGSGFPKSMDVAKAIDKMRVEDVEPIRAVCRVIRAAMDARGLRSRDLVEHFDGCHPRLIDHWAARDTDSQPSLPTIAQWETLRDVLAITDSDVDAEVRRLNARKGEFGEAFKSRAVTGVVAEWTDRTNYALTSRDGLRRDAAIAGSAAEAWQGWGTALKPAFEPIVVARKPLAGTVAANVLTYGTGALNIDACRVETTDDLNGGAYSKNGGRSVSGSLNPSGMNREGATAHGEYVQPSGRFPANVLLDESQAAALDKQSGVLTSGLMPPGTPKRGKAAGILGEFKPQESTSATYGDSGGASRFFPIFRYVGKAPSSERPEVDGTVHATVKPLELMRWLIRLVTRPGGRVLDPFAGSGTTGEAALLESMEVDLIELEADHLPLILQRVRKPLQPPIFGGWEGGDVA
ncbi:MULTISPECIES: DNA methyltransferase [unclassified Microbacterium]|uniref:DNA methyltransferase n=1 Tax=unclassified Microbacterium TaxID=2609290 RepID=UPI00300F82D8